MIVSLDVDFLWLISLKQRMENYVLILETSLLDPTNTIETANQISSGDISKINERMNKEGCIHELVNLNIKIASTIFHNIVCNIGTIIYYKRTRRIFRATTSSGNGLLSHL